LELFEGLWPIPRGVSLNTYLVRGKKIALIDLVRDWCEAPKQLEAGLASLGLDFSSIDYLVLNHLEPDHTGWLREFRALNPRAEILSTAKGQALVKSFYKIDGGLRAVKDGDVLDLGEGLELRFFETPNVHWPETMVTWEAGSKTLFACDAFGSYGSLGDRVFDDEYSPEEHALFEGECLRYYANIVASFSPFVERAVQKVGGLEIRCVAPSHGIVWRREPKKIIERYLRYASYTKGPAEPEIAVIWGSMYGSTRAGLDAALRGIEAEGVPYSIRRIPDESLSYVLAEAYKSRGLLLAMPTYEYAMFPPMAFTLDMFRRKHIGGKTVLRIGPWGWAGGARKEYEAAIEALKWKSLESLEWNGSPGAEDLEALERRGRELARAVKA
jgi:flavorubredoxin